MVIAAIPKQKKEQQQTLSLSSAESAGITAASDYDAPSTATAFLTDNTNKNNNNKSSQLSVSSSTSALTKRSALSRVPKYKVCHKKMQRQLDESEKVTTMSMDLDIDNEDSDGSVHCQDAIDYQNDIYVDGSPSATMATTTENTSSSINDTILASTETITTSYASSPINKRTTRLNIDPTLVTAAKQTIANKLLEGYVLKGRSEICFRCQMPLMVKKISDEVDRVAVDVDVDDSHDTHNVEEWGNILREYDEDGVCVVCNEADVSEEAFERRLVMFSYAAADGADDTSTSSKEENDGHGQEHVGGDLASATKNKNKLSRQKMATITAPKQTAAEEMNACLESMEQRRECNDDQKKHVTFGQFDPLIAQDTLEEDELLDETATDDEGEELMLDEPKEESAREEGGRRSEEMTKRNQGHNEDEDDLLQFNSNEIIPLDDINILPDDITFAIEIMLNNHRCENCAMDMELNAGSGVMECPFCTVVRLDDEVGTDDSLVVDNEEESYLTKLPIYGRIVGVACLDEDEETKGHQHQTVMVDAEEGDDEETILFDVQEEEREGEEYSVEDEDESILQSEIDDESSATLEDGETENKNAVIDFALKTDVDEILSQEFVKMWDKELVGEEGGIKKNDNDDHKTEEGQDGMKPADGSGRPPLTFIEVKPMSSKMEQQHDKQVEDTKNETTSKEPHHHVESVTRTSVAESSTSHTGSPIFEDYLAKLLAEKMESKPSQSPVKNTTAALESACPDKAVVVKNLITKFWKRNIMDEQKRKQHQQQKQEQPSTNGWHQLEQAVKAAQNAKKKDMYSELISCNVPQKTVHSLQDVLEAPRQSFKDPPADNVAVEQVRYGSGIDPPSSSADTPVAEISVSGMEGRSSRHFTANSCMDHPPVAKNMSFIAKTENNRKGEFEVSGVKHKSSYPSINNDHATPPHPGIPESRNDNISVLTFNTADQGLEQCDSSVPSDVGGTCCGDLSMNEDDVRRQLRQLEFHFNHMSSSSDSTGSSGILSSNHSNLGYNSSQAKMNHHHSVSGINKHPLSTMSWSTTGGHLATISESSAQTPTQSTRHCNISKDPKPLSPNAEARRQRYKKELMARKNKPTEVSIE